MLSELVLCAGRAVATHLDGETVEETTEPVEFGTAETCSTLVDTAVGREDLTTLVDLLVVCNLAGK
jgi:hypothetical protein